MCVNSCQKNENPATSLRQKDNPAIKMAGLTSTLKNPVVNGRAKQYEFLCGLPASPKASQGKLRPLLLIFI